MSETRRLLRIVRALPLALEILASYVRVRWYLRRYELREAVTRLRGEAVAEPAQRSQAETEAALRLGRAVIRTLRLLPTDSRCLMRSLVLTRVLARRGLDSTLVIGVMSGPDFAAHAWLEHGDVPVLPGDGGAFRRLVTL
ncbi:MAG TPA: lasso peptide biosynthesis B2 protein [Gaiellaceae bacterium]|jgi:hypothetical protein